MKKLFLFLCTLLPLFLWNCSNNNETPQSSGQIETKTTPRPQSQIAYQSPRPQTSSTLSASSAPPAFRSIGPVEAQKLMSQKNNLLIVDVRTPKELREGKIANSQLLPFFGLLRGQHNLPRDKPILLVCAVGGRSFAAGQVLVKQGYKEIYNLGGGISAWKKANLPLVYN